MDKYAESRFLTFFAPRASASGFVGTLAGSLSILPPATTPISTSVPAERNERKSESVLSAPLDAQAVKESKIRFNDGGIDPAGRVFFGSMGIDESAKDPKGELWRFDPATKKETKILDGIGCSNGLGWSPDGKTVCECSLTSHIVRERQPTKAQNTTQTTSTRHTTSSTHSPTPPQGILSRGGRSLLARQHQTTLVVQKGHMMVSAWTE